MAYYIIKVASIECLEVVKEYSFRCAELPEPIEIFKLTKGIILEATQKQHKLHEVDFVRINGIWQEN
jgi:hypothetical protein